MLKKYEYILKNLDCANCANKIQNKIAENENYKDVVVNFNTLKLTLYSDLEEDKIEKDVKDIVGKLEPEVDVIKFNTKTKNDKSNNEKNYKIHLIRLILGIIFTIIAFSIANIFVKKSLMIAAYVILLSRTAWNALKLLKKGTIDESFLITISCIGAYIVGEEFEGLMVILLYEIGKVLEEKAVNHTRKSIADLMDIKPEYANLKVKENIERVSPENVHIGDTIIIKSRRKNTFRWNYYKRRGKIKYFLFNRRKCAYKCKSK